MGLMIQKPLYAKINIDPTKSYVKSLYSLPLSLDPIQMNDTASLVVANLIYDGLLKFSPTLKIESSIAESWSTSKDGRTLTFKIRKNAKFHDGSKITAQDALASLSRALSSTSKVRKYYDCIVGSEKNYKDSNSSPEGLKAISEDSLQISLKHPFPPFLSVLAGATAKILPAKYLNSRNFFIKPIGSGPFKYSNLDTHKKEITLDAFNEYYDDPPFISRMILRESNEEEALRMASRGEIQDLSNWPLTANNGIFSKGKRISSPVAATWIIGINTTKKPFNDLHVRQMFKAAVDTEGFRLRFYPDAIPAHGYIPYGLPGYESRFVSRIKNTILPKNKISIVIPKELESATQMKTYLETDLLKKGWNVEVLLLPWDQLMEGYVKKAHQAFLVSMNMDYPDAEFLLKNFEYTNTDNFSGLRNLKLDSLLKEARNLQDRKQRQSLYREALRLTEESAVTINLFHPRANYWISKCVDGFKANILSDVYIDYRKIQLIPNCDLKNVNVLVKNEK